MAEHRKVIITAAITDGVHTPTMSPHLPVTPDSTAEQAIAAAVAGAAILHLHARDEVGTPASAPEEYLAYLPRLKPATDAVINITTGGGLGMTLDQRLAAARHLRPEVCSLNMGTMNSVVSHLAEKALDWKHPWERDYLASTWDGVYKNTFRDIEIIATTLGGEHGSRFEFECYDVAPPYALAHFLDRGTIRPPLLVQTIFGILGASAPTLRSSCTCAKPPTASSASTTSGPPSPPAAPSSRCSPRRLPWAPTSASASRTTSTSAPASSPPA